MNFLTEHGIGSYEELVERCDAVAAASIRTRESLRDTEQRITDLSLLGKQIDTYRKLKPVYDRYKASKDKEKFLRGFESEIILFEAAAREIKKAGLTKLPSAEKLKAELGGLSKIIWFPFCRFNFITAVIFFTGLPITKNHH